MDDVILLSDSSSDDSADNAPTPPAQTSPGASMSLADRIRGRHAALALRLSSSPLPDESAAAPSPVTLLSLTPPSDGGAPSQSRTPRPMYAISSGSEPAGASESAIRKRVRFCAVGVLQHFADPLRVLLRMHFLRCVPFIPAIPQGASPECWGEARSLTRCPATPRADSDPDSSTPGLSQFAPPVAKKSRPLQLPPRAPPPASASVRSATPSAAQDMPLPELWVSPALMTMFDCANDKARDTLLREDLKAHVVLDSELSGGSLGGAAAAWWPDLGCAMVFAPAASVWGLGSMELAARIAGWRAALAAGEGLPRITLCTVGMADYVRRRVVREPQQHVRTMEAMLAVALESPDGGVQVRHSGDARHAVYALAHMAGLMNDPTMPTLVLDLLKEPKKKARPSDWVALLTQVPGVSDAKAKLIAAEYGSVDALCRALDAAAAPESLLEDLVAPGKKMKLGTVISKRIARIFTTMDGDQDVGR